MGGRDPEEQKEQKTGETFSHLNVRHPYYYPDTITPGFMIPFGSSIFFIRFTKP